MGKLYLQTETAKALGVSYDTIRRWKKDGRLKTVTVGKREKVREEDILEILNGRNDKIITLASKLTTAGYSADETARIINIVNDVI